MCVFVCVCVCYAKEKYLHRKEKKKVPDRELPIYIQALVIFMAGEAKQNKWRLF